MKALGHVALDEKIFSCFPHISLCKICDPRSLVFRFLSMLNIINNLLYDVKFVEMCNGIS